LIVAERAGEKAAVAYVKLVFGLQLVGRARVVQKQALVLLLEGGVYGLAVLHLNLQLGTKQLGARATLLAGLTSIERSMVEFFKAAVLRLLLLLPLGFRRGCFRMGRSPSMRMALAEGAVPLLLLLSVEVESLGLVLVAR